MHNNVAWYIAYHDCKFKSPSTSNSRKIFWLYCNASKRRSELQLSITIEAFNFLRVDASKLLEQKSSLRCRLSNALHSVTSKPTTKQENQLGLSTDKTAGMSGISKPISNGNIWPLNCSLISFHPNSNSETSYTGHLRYIERLFGKTWDNLTVTSWVSSEEHIKCHCRWWYISPQCRRLNSPS